MKASPARAMVLAAGFATRLRPLSLLKPKPLVPLANRPLIHFAMDQLAAAGVDTAVVNSHHLGEQLPGVLGNSHRGLRLIFSHEEKILGTGGGLVQARRHLEDSPFFLINGDVLSDVDLRAAWKHHRRGGYAATMVVRALPADSAYTALQADTSGRLVTFKEHRLTARGEIRACMFCGIHVLEPEVFSYLPEQGFACINDQAYGRMMDRGLDIGAYFYDGPWFDLGTPQTYLQANLDLLGGRLRLKDKEPRCGADDQGVLLGHKLSLEAGVQLGPEVAIGEGCRIGAGAKLSRCVLWPGSHIESGACLDRCIAAGEHFIKL